jgi:uncharacterized membrane protein YvlD (DUF360 family)
MCAIVFALQALPMTFISIKMYNSLSVRTVLTISVSLQLFGAWIRIGAFAIDEFWPVLVGTSILSVSHTFVQSAQNLMIN